MYSKGRTSRCLGTLQELAPVRTTYHNIMYPMSRPSNARHILIWHHGHDVAELFARTYIKNWLALSGFRTETCPKASTMSRKWRISMWDEWTIQNWCQWKQVQWKSSRPASRRSMATVWTALETCVWAAHRKGTINRRTRGFVMIFQEYRIRLFGFSFDV